MSQQLISQKIKRTCEGCGLEKEWELVGAPAEQVVEMTQWYTIIREVYDPQEQHFVKLTVQACSLPCVPAAAVKVAVLPQNDEPADPIDLGSLRNNGMIQ